MNTENTTDLILIPDNMPLADIWTPENVDAMIAKLEQYNDDFMGDATTAKGRKEIISFSRKYSTSKVLVDGTGKELVDGWKSQAKVVDAQRKRFRETCDRLRDESRKPVTDFENAEKMLVANQNRTLSRLVVLYNTASDLDVAAYEAYIEEVNSIEIDGDILSDFYTRGNREKEQALNSLEQKLAAKIQYNKDQADLAKLREAEEKRQAEETRKSQEKFAKANEKKIKLQAKKDAEEKATKKIAAAKADAEKAQREQIEAGERAEREKKEAVAAAEKKAQSEADQKEKERLAKIESKRIEDEQRASNEEHREKIKLESRSALIGILGISLAQADGIFYAIDSGKVPNISIKY